MIEYETAVTLFFSTNVRPETDSKNEIKQSIKQFIEQFGIEAFLDKLEYGPVTEVELSQEEIDDSRGERLVPIAKLKEMLLAISLGIMEVEGITKEEAEADLKKLSEDYDTPID